MHGCESNSTFIGLDLGIGSKEHGAHKECQKYLTRCIKGIIPRPSVICRKQGGNDTDKQDNFNYPMNMCSNVLCWTRHWLYSVSTRVFSLIGRLHRGHRAMHSTRM